MASLICNTSPLQYLHQLSLLHLLPKLADEVMVPNAVVRELEVGRALGVNVPDPRVLPWLRLAGAVNATVLPLITDLGAGEIEVLALGLEHPGKVAVLDDKLARTFAQVLGLPFTGTLGLLLDAKQRGFIEVIKPQLDTLELLGFRVSTGTRATVLRRSGET